MEPTGGGGLIQVSSSFFTSHNVHRTASQLLPTLLQHSFDISTHLRPHSHPILNHSSQLRAITSTLRSFAPNHIPHPFHCYSIVARPFLHSSERFRTSASPVATSWHYFELFLRTSHKLRYPLDRTRSTALPLSFHINATIPITLRPYLRTCDRICEPSAIFSPNSALLPRSLSQSCSTAPYLYSSIWRPPLQYPRHSHTPANAFATALHICDPVWQSHLEFSSSSHQTRCITSPLVLHPRTPCLALCPCPATLSHLISTSATLPHFTASSGIFSSCFSGLESQIVGI